MKIGRQSIPTPPATTFPASSVFPPPNSSRLSAYGSPNCNVSPTYEISARNPFVSPASAKTGGCIPPVKNVGVPTFFNFPLFFRRFQIFNLPQACPERLLRGVRILASNSNYSRTYRYPRGRGIPVPWSDHLAPFNTVPRSTSNFELCTPSPNSFPCVSYAKPRGVGVLPLFAIYRSLLTRTHQSLLRGSDHTLLARHSPPATRHFFSRDPCYSFHSALHPAGESHHA